MQIHAIAQSLKEITADTPALANKFPGGLWFGERAGSDTEEGEGLVPYGLIDVTEAGAGYLRRRLDRGGDPTHPRRRRHPGNLPPVLGPDTCSAIPDKRGKTGWKAPPGGKRHDRSTEQATRQGRYRGFHVMDAAPFRIIP